VDPDGHGSKGWKVLKTVGRLVFENAPVAGDLVSVGTAIVGKDLAGQQMSGWERAEPGVTGLIGVATGGAGSKAIKGLKLAGTLLTGGAAAYGGVKAVKKLANAAEAATTAGRHADDAADAARALPARVAKAEPSTPTKPRYEVTPDGVAIPTDPVELKTNLARLDDTSTKPATSRKFVREDSSGPIRVRVEKAHPDDPNFTGTPDPLHTVDHAHIDRRANVTSGSWGSKEKVPYDWPF